MSINKYRLYVQSVFDLAKTLSIKSEYSAIKVNEALNINYPTLQIDTYDKASWKYYLNMCGEYHSTDSSMTFKSLDTMQTIVFNKSNLALHASSALAYRYGSRYYRELVARYPEQESLIHGILYPAVMADLLAAPDFTVVAYPSYLVEENEEDLILNINQWISNFMHRYYVRGYRATDQLYYASLLGVMFSRMVPLVLYLRKQACKTRQAHSYHVNQYLASHGMLDVYLDQLSPKQAMFLYKNINYIERHAGMQDNFDWLLENLLTDRGIPLSEYSMSQSDVNMPNSLLAVPDMVLTPLNRVAARQSTFTVSEVMHKEVQIAPGNSSRVEETAISTAERLAYSANARLKTKVLESALVTSSDTGITNEVDVALNFWGYASASNRYNIYIRIKHPVTGAEIPIPQRVAYHYFLYAYSCVNFKPFEKIPPVYASRIPIWPAPSLAQAYSVVDSAYVSEGTVENIWELHPTDEAYFSVAGFRSKVADMTQRANAQAHLVAQEEHMYSRGLLQGAMERMFSHYILTDSLTERDAIEVFEENELPVSGLTTLEWQAIYLSLFEEATGVSLQATVTKSSLQTSLIKLFKQLSSYSIQFVSDVLTSDVVTLNWAALRLGDVRGTSGSYFNILVAMINQIKASYGVKLKLYSYMDDLVNDANFLAAGSRSGEMDPWVRVSDTIREGLLRYPVMIPQVTSAAGLVYGTDTSMDVFNAMTDEERSRIKDIYTFRCKPHWEIPSKVDINDLVPEGSILPSFLPSSQTPVTFPSWGALSMPRRLRYFQDDNNVVVLNGIYYFGGSNETDVFRPNFGTSLVTSFRLVPSAGVQPRLNAFRLTAGTPFSADFTPGATLHDLVMPSFVNVARFHSFAMETQQEVIRLDYNFAQLPSVAVLKFVNKARIVRLTMKLKTKSIQLPVFKAGKVVRNISFKAAPRSMVLPSIVAEYRDIRLPVLTVERRAFELLPFKPGRSIQLPSLVGYGNIYLTIHEYQPVPGAPSSPAGTTGTRTAVLEFGNQQEVIVNDQVRFDNQQRVIDIPNFAALMAQL